MTHSTPTLRVGFAHNPRGKGVLVEIERCYRIFPFQEHAMKSFLARFGQFISFVLSGFDRLRFRGESRRLNNERGVDSYLYQHKIRYTEFPAHAERLTKTLCQQTEERAQQE